MPDTILTPERVIPFLQHDDRMVQHHALRYFHDSSDIGPLTADHYWAVIDRRGEVDDALGFASALDDVPQTDASLSRLVRALGSKPRELFEFHYQHVAREMDLAVLGRNREELLGCPQLLPHVREHLELRLKLLDESPAVAWLRLMAHGHELGRAYAFTFNTSLSDALIEAAARGGPLVFEEAMRTLKDETAFEDWREIFAVRVLGAGRYEPAIDALLQKMNVDADVLREDVNRALSSIGSPPIIDRIVDFYPGKPWHVRLYTHGCLANIKRPQSVVALLKLLEIESAIDSQIDEDEEHEPLTEALLLDLTTLCSLAALEKSREVIAADPKDPEVMDLCETLLATATMHGTALPEEVEWRRVLAKRQEPSVAKVDSMFVGVRDRWRKTGIASFTDPDADNQEIRDDFTPAVLRSAPDPEWVEPIRNTAPKVGRNEPCPCGSGKKYKKCCGNK